MSWAVNLGDAAGTVIVPEVRQSNAAQAFLVVDLLGTFLAVLEDAAAAAASALATASAGRGSSVRGRGPAARHKV